MYQYKANVVRWIDGDTLIARIDLGFEVQIRKRIRLLRINAAELKSKVPYRSKMARKALREARKICPEGSAIIIETKKTKDRYARYLAEVVVDKLNVSDALLERKLVKPWR